jgi:predicted MFS family arabinose efflux permease
MLLMITGVGTAVFVYAGGYLAGHPQQRRLFVLLTLFMVAMIGCVTADNLIAAVRVLGGSPACCPSCWWASTTTDPASRRRRSRRCWSPAPAASRCWRASSCWRRRWAPRR